MKVKYNLAQRIWIKFLHYVNLCVGKFVDLLVRMKIWGKVPFEIKGHFDDAIEVEHAYPKNYNPADKQKFDEWKKYKTFPHDLFFAKNVLVTTEGIALQKNHTWIEALPHPIFRYQYGILYNLFVRIFYRRKKLDNKKKYLLVYDNWSGGNYFHWMIDSQCRLQLLKENVKENFTVLMREDAPKYIFESLKLYGFTDLVLLPKKCKARVPNLYVMNYAAWSGQQHPATLSAVREFVCSQIPHASEKKERRIYASRSKAGSRKVANENELIDHLKKNNFEIIHFEGMSFSDQVSLMQNVKYFVSSHGANMTNLIYMPKGAKILELIKGEGRSNFCYWSVASSLGFDYYYQLCELNDSDNVKVDMEIFKKNLELLLK